MKNNLTKAQIEIIKNQLKKIFKIKCDIEHIFAEDRILFFYGKIFVGLFYYDELHFDKNNNFYIIDNESANRTYESSDWYAWIEGNKIEYVIDIDDNVLRYLFQIQCKYYYDFIMRSPNKHLNKWEQYWKGRLVNNTLRCPFCECNSLFSFTAHLQCVICEKYFDYKNHFNFCELNHELTLSTYILDNFVMSYLASDLNFYLYIVAITLVEELGLNLELDEFCDSMRCYEKRGFDAHDDEGNVYTFFWFLNRCNFEWLYTKPASLKYYWEDQFIDIEILAEEISGKYPDKKISILCVDTPCNFLKINSTIEKSKVNKTIRTLNNEWETKIQEYNFGKVQKIYFFKSIAKLHHVLGLREVTYPFLRYLLGSLDQYLHIYDVSQKKLSFGGPKHGFMDMFLNEIDAIVEINRLDLCCYSFDYSVSLTGVLTKSFIAQEEIIMLLDFFDNNKEKIAKLKAYINQKIFNKVS